jgi:curli biogenesis system outer membrane secretion channel CsgG
MRMFHLLTAAVAILIAVSAAATIKQSTVVTTAPQQPAAISKELPLPTRNMSSPMVHRHQKMRSSSA